MSLFKKIILLIVVPILFLTILNTVHAQEIEESQPKRTIQTRDLNISNVQINKSQYSEGDIVKGTFTIENFSNKIYPDLYYGVSLMTDYRPDGIPLNSVETKDGSTITVPQNGGSFDFEYQIPYGLDLQKEYGVVISLKKKTGISIRTSFLKAHSKIGYIIQDSANESEWVDVIDVSFEKNGDRFSPHAGPYVQDNDDVFVYAVVSTSTTEIPTRVNLKLTDFENQFENVVYQEVQEVQIVDKLIKVLIKKPDQPGVYVGEITLIDQFDKVVSKPLTFRFIRDGQIITIHDAKANKTSGLKGEEINIQSVITGMPPNTETDQVPDNEEGINIVVNLIDQDGELVANYKELFDPKPKNNKNNLVHNLDANITLEKDARAIELSIQVLDKNGKVLESYGTGLLAEPIESDYKTTLVTILAIILITALIIIYYLKRKNEKSPTINAFSIIIFVLFLSVFFNYPNGALGYNTGTYSGDDSELGVAQIDTQFYSDRLGMYFSWWFFDTLETMATYGETNSGAVVYLKGYLTESDIETQSDGIYSPNDSYYVVLELEDTGYVEYGSGPGFEGCGNSAGSSNDGQSLISASNLEREPITKIILPDGSVYSDNNYVLVTNGIHYYYIISSYDISELNKQPFKAENLSGDYAIKYEITEGSMSIEHYTESNYPAIPFQGIWHWYDFSIAPIGLPTDIIGRPFEYQNHTWFISKRPWKNGTTISSLWRSFYPGEPAPQEYKVFTGHIPYRVSGELPPEEPVEPAPEEPVEPACAINPSESDLQSQNNLCSSGTETEYSSTEKTDGSTTYTWTCSETGFTDVNCSADINEAPPTHIDGQCAILGGINYNSVDLLNPPKAACSIGNVIDFNKDNDKWEWDCRGINGGQNATGCTADITCTNGNWDPSSKSCTNSTTGTSPTVTWKFNPNIVNQDDNCVAEITLESGSLQSCTLSKLSGDSVGSIYNLTSVYINKTVEIDDSRIGPGFEYSLSCDYDRGDGTTATEIFSQIKKCYLNPSYSE